MQSIYLTIALAPLVAAIVAGLFGRTIGRTGAQSITIAGVALSCALSMYVLWKLVVDGMAPYNGTVYTWLVSDGLTMEVGFLIDRLSALMMVVVTFVSLMVHIYTIGYMHDDDGYQRFFSYISLFTFSMLMLVMSNNFMQLFFGWEAVGLVSYLLIGFWYTRPSAVFANLKAFLVNRVGDFGFVLGIAAVLHFTGSLDYATVFGHTDKFAGGLIHVTNTTSWSAITFTCICLFIGAMGKSAQVPLHVWLPDSMEGPTPISALIHAATMVTAGIFMVARMSPLFELSETALSFVLIIGATTAFFMGLLGIVNNDIKRVIAYSTLSQLGYMTVALGVSAYSAGIFHLMTHAFFKGLLFLAAGSVIHAMSGEQDMLKMGALAKKIPTTYRTMLIATLAIAGIPPLAGFFSKDEILGRTFGVNHFLWLVGWITAGVTAFYMFRLLFLTFHGESRVSPEAEHHIHESPSSMTVPLVILALLSIVGGWVGIGGRFEKFLAPVITLPDAYAYVTFGPHLPNGTREIALSSGGPGSPPDYVLTVTDAELSSMAQQAEKEKREGTPESLLMILSVAAALAGIGLAWQLYIKRTDLPAKIAARTRWLYRLVYEKYYVDQIYDAMFVNRVKDLGLALGAFDRIFIDGLFVNGAGRVTRVTSVISGWWDKWFVDGLVNLGARIFWLVSYPMRMLQTGRVGSYALLIVVGMLLFLGYYLHAAGFTMANLWH